MILGLGIDVAELDRVENIHRRHGRRFAERLLTPAELEALPALPVPYLAARFAAKEAAVKALGTGFREAVGYRSVEVLADALGKPLLRFHGAALERARALGVVRSHVSLTHGRDVAAAVVVLEGE